MDAADYTVWRDALGSTTDLGANGDNSGASAGKIDQADYDLWKTNFGMRVGNGAREGVASMVPEAYAAALLVIGCVVALVAPRRDYRRQFAIARPLLQRFYCSEMPAQPILEMLRSRGGNRGDRVIREAVCRCHVSSAISAAATRSR